MSEVRQVRNSYYSIMRIRDRHEVLGGTLRRKPDSDKDLEGSTVYLGLGNLWHTVRCLSFRNVFLFIPNGVAHR
jgi:hypothetical protein